MAAGSQLPNEITIMRDLIVQ